MVEAEDEYGVGGMSGSWAGVAVEPAARWPSSSGGGGGGSSSSGGGGGSSSSNSSSSSNNNNSSGAVSRPKCSEVLWLAWQ